MHAANCSCIPETTCGKRRGDCSHITCRENVIGAAQISHQSAMQPSALLLPESPNTLHHLWSMTMTAARRQVRVCPCGSPLEEIPRCSLGTPPDIRRFCTNQWECMGLPGIAKESMRNAKVRPCDFTVTQITALQLGE